MAQLQIQPFGRTARVPRRPQHTFVVDCQPWALTPFFIAPVLPGETMKNLLFQARVVTDPIKEPLIGWWFETFFWYVKHRDLMAGVSAAQVGNTLVDMMIDPAVKPPTSGSGNSHLYTNANSVQYILWCSSRCVETYFRDEGEAAAVATIGNYFASQVSQRSPLDSALSEADYTAGQAASNIVVGADDTITGAELSQSYLLWQAYRANNITNLTYEEYLATYGIPIPQGQEGSRRPELIRYVKEWSYPVNTVDPATGTPSSAVSWAIAERADKDRFFREPGFLFGMMVARPKCYLANQKASVSAWLTDALAWLPAVLGDNPEYSVRSFAAGTGPFSNSTAAYRVDLKDLFLYGEQYSNKTIGAGLSNGVTLPAVAWANKKYATLADADALFKVPTSNKIRVDGVVSLNILGMQVDTTPTQAPGGF